MKLIDLYKSILTYCGLTVDDHGFVNKVTRDSTDPTIIDGARLVMPIDRHLKNFDPDEKIIFHPLAEDIFKGESPVIKKLVINLNNKLNYSIGVLTHALLNLAASNEYHSKLTPEQADLIIAVNNCDSKTVTTFGELMVKGVRDRHDRLFTNIYLKHGGSYKGKKYSRVGVTSFSFYEDLKADKIDKLRVKDKESYIKIFQYIFPDIDDLEEYNYGSKSGIAPYLDALMMTSAKITIRINDVVTLFKSYIDDYEEVMFEADWYTQFLNLDDMQPEIRRIPMQNGNNGPIVQEQQNQSGPVMTPVNTQQQTPNQPQQQMMMVPAKPELKMTKGGLDFKSVMQNNPAIAMAGSNNPFVNRLQYQNMMRNSQMMAVQQAPTWANGQPVMMQQPMMMNQQPMMVQQPMIQQPMMQQPMMMNQQPMMQQPMMVQTPVYYPQQGQMPMGGYNPNQNFAPVPYNPMANTPPTWS